MRKLTEQKKTSAECVMGAIRPVQEKTACYIKHQNKTFATFGLDKSTEVFACLFVFYCLSGMTLCVSSLHVNVTFHRLAWCLLHSKILLGAFFCFFFTSLLSPES